MSSKIKFISIFCFFIFCFFIFFLSLKDSKKYTPKALMDKKIINFKMKQLESDEIITEKDIFEINKITLLNIWSSWCLPCREEHKYLTELKMNTRLNMVGINYKDKKKNAQNFLSEFGNPYSLILVDDDGKNSINFGAYGVPETFIYNSKKKLIKKIVGPIDLKTFNEIKNILK